MLSSCANLNLGDISLSRFRSYAHCHGLTKRYCSARPFEAWLTRLFAQCGVQDLKYMISRQSHRFLCNLGIIALNPCDYLY